MKLGEILIQAKAITHAQLEEALKAQLIYGGHLGTCLIERGMLTEKQLGEALAKAAGVPCATTEVFEDIPLAVIECVPKHIVEKHYVVPFRLVDKTLDVAMLYPNNLRVVDELTFASGRKVKPWIAPEVRLMQAMDRYYDVARRMRFIALARQLDGSDAAIGGLDVGDEPRCQPVASAPTPTTRMPARAGATSTATATATAKAATAKTAAAIVDRKKASSAPPLPTSTSEDPLEPLANLLCRVASESTLGQIVLQHAVPDAARSVLFTVQAGAAVPWAWRGIDIADDIAKSITFPITGEPLFSLLLGDGSYRGPLPDDERYLGFYETLGIEPPNEFVLVPCYADDRLVSLLYFDAEDGMGIEEETMTFHRIARKVGLALNLIQIKQQIRRV